MSEVPLWRPDGSPTPGGASGDGRLHIVYRQVSEVPYVESLHFEPSLDALIQVYGPTS